MKIQVKVNQSESLRRGVNAPQHVTEIDITPESLQQSDREAIAGRLVGHRLQKASLPDGWEEIYVVRLDDRDPEKSLLTIPEPTLAGILEQIEADRVGFLRQIDDRKNAQAKKEEEAAEKILEFVKSSQETPWKNLDICNVSRENPIEEIERLITGTNCFSPIKISPHAPYDQANSYIVEALVRVQVECDRLEAIRLAAEKARKEKAAEAIDRKTDRLKPHMLPAELTLLGRGRLNLTHVEKRLTQAELSRLLQALNGVPQPEKFQGAIEIHAGHETRGTEHKSWTTDVLPAVELVEHITRHPVVMIREYVITADPLALNTSVTVTWQDEPLPVSVHFLESED